MGLEQLQAGGMVPVVAIDVGVEGPGVDDQCDGWTSLARISSIRSEISARPLAPAPAASSLRLPCWAPSRFSIASRVSSDTVLPRRSASWRRRASSSSDSFTVVLCMYASIQHRSILVVARYRARQPHRPPAVRRRPERFGPGLSVVSEGSSASAIIEVGEDGGDAPVEVGFVEKSQFGEDRPDVLLDR